MRTTFWGAVHRAPANESKGPKGRLIGKSAYSKLARVTLRDWMTIQIVMSLVTILFPRLLPRRQGIMSCSIA